MAGVELPNKPINRKEQYLAKAAGQAVEVPAFPITREEAYLEEIAKQGGGSGTTDYEVLDNKPQIGGVELSGNKSLADLGIASAESVTEIKDGTDIDSFADVEEALENKTNNDDVVADAFSVAETYAAGDYCTYEGGLYKFKTAHEGAWDAADVDRIKIAGELSELKNTLIAFPDYANGILILDNNTNYPYTYTVPDDGFIIFSRVYTDNTSGAKLSINNTYMITCSGNLEFSGGVFPVRKNDVAVFNGLLGSARAWFVKFR